MKKLALLTGLLMLLSACSGGPGPKPPAPGVKVGKPYVIDGQTYYPEYDPHYDRTGMASWYGPGFHGEKTANGERFDQDELTAAHPTLPMPSLVRVTNLENGRSAVIRINDRGPFKDSRLIDLSRASAKTLGVTGLSKVRVQYLKSETDQYWAQMNLRRDDIQFAKNDRFAPPPDDDADDQNIVSTVRPDDMPPQIKDSAPFMSVTSNDLASPQPDAIRPERPRLRVISDAQAEELPNRPVQVAHNNIKQPFVSPTEDASQYNARGQPPMREYNKSPPAVGGERWYVQAGSFASPENAKRLADQLSPVGNTELATVDMGGKTWHRVRLGPFSGREVAEHALEKALNNGADGAKIVKD